MPELNQKTRGISFSNCKSVEGIWLGLTPLIKTLSTNAKLKYIHFLITFPHFLCPYANLNLILSLFPLDGFNPFQIGSYFSTLMCPIFDSKFLGLPLHDCLGPSMRHKVQFFFIRQVLKSITCANVFGLPNKMTHTGIFTNLFLNKCSFLNKYSYIPLHLDTQSFILQKNYVIAFWLTFSLSQVLPLLKAL